MDNYFYQVRKSTGDILKQGWDIYPRADLAPIVGLDPDLVWCIKRIQFTQPEYDSRLFVMQTTENITETPDDEFPHMNKVEITYSTEKRPNDYIALQIENAEILANQGALSPDRQLEAIINAMNVLIKTDKKLNVSEEEQLDLERISEIAVKFKKNKAAKLDKIQELADGLEPNIDEGWEKE